MDRRSRASVVWPLNVNRKQPSTSIDSSSSIVTPPANYNFAQEGSHTNNTLRTVNTENYNIDDLESIPPVTPVTEAGKNLASLINRKQLLINSSNYVKVHFLMIMIDRYLKLHNHKNDITLTEEIQLFLDSFNTIQADLNAQENSELLEKILKLHEKIEKKYYEISLPIMCLTDFQRDIQYAESSHMTPAAQSRVVKSVSLTIEKFIISDLQSDGFINRFIPTCVKILVLLNDEQIKKISTLLVHTLLQINLETIRISCVKTLLSFLIKECHTNGCYFAALENILLIEGIQNFIRENSEIDKYFIDSLNSSVMKQQDSAKHYLLYINTFERVLTQNKKRLTEIVKEIQFTNSHELAQTFYKIFMSTPRSRNILKTRIFLDSLIDSMKLHHFSHEIVTMGLEEETVYHLNLLLANTPSQDQWVRQLITCETEHCANQKFQVHALLTPAFLFLSRHKSGISDLFFWYRVLYYLGINTSGIEQKTLCSEETKEHRIKLLTETTSHLEKLYNYFHANNNHQNEFSKIYAKLTELLVTAIRLTTSKGIELSLQMIQEFITHFVNVNKDHMNFILTYKNKKLGEYENGVSAILEIITDLSQNSTPSEWPTHSISDRIYFIYCYAKYPFEQYRQWFLTSNEQYKDYLTHTLPNSSEEAVSFQKSLAGQEHLPNIGFKILQNSQLAAIKCAISPPENTKYVFEKVGTGQGKSLIIALTALHYALRHKTTKIYVFTVYQHLAIRDFNRFKPLFDKYNIKSVHIKNKTSILSNDYQIIYAELGTYFSAMASQIERKINNTLSSEDTFDFYESGIVLLDEFDSIILDSSQFGNTVYDNQEIFQLGKLTQEELLSVESFKETLARKSNMGNFFEALKKNQLDQWVSNWFASAGWGKGRNGYDALCIFHHYIGGELWELTEGRFYTKMTYFKTLVFLKNSERVFGFSGSIDKKAISRFEHLFPNYAYFEIPPFFGINRTNNRLLFTSQNDPLRYNSWNTKIRESMVDAIKRQQPILIFANIEDQNEWRLVQELSENLSREHNRKLIILDKEDLITDNTLANVTKKNTITIASHVASRGADFIVQPDLFHECEGLHVMITYLPTNKGYLDLRILIQMIGRTARMENTGTHEIIVKNNPSVETADPITVSTEQEKYHYLIAQLYKKIKDQPYDKNLWRMWLLLNLFIDSSKTYPSTLSDCGNVEQQADFILDKIMGIITTANSCSNPNSDIDSDSDVNLNFDTHSNSERNRRSPPNQQGLFQSRTRYLEPEQVETTQRNRKSRSFKCCIL